MAAAVHARVSGGRSSVTFGAPIGSPSIDPAAAEPTDRCPEIDCIRGVLTAETIEAAERRATALGVGADRVLIAAAELSEEAYLRALGERHGITFEPLDDTPRAFCPLDDERLVESAAAGMLPLTIDDELYLVVAPRGGAVRRILQLIEQNPARARRFRFTSAERLNRFVMHHGGKAVAARAADLLKHTWPQFSAAPRRWRAKIVSAAIVVLPALAAAAVAPAIAALAVEVTLAAVFAAWVALRLIGAFVKPVEPNTSRRLPDDALPVYTVIAALYREAASVDGLLTAIESFDYPGTMAQTPQDGKMGYY
ncbi:MAG: hypothetical protein ACREB8_06115 [Pseudolabrys sp.]